MTKRFHPPGWISPYERRQIRLALAQIPKPVTRTGRPSSLENRIVRTGVRHERELVAAAYAEAARRRNSL